MDSSHNIILNLQTKYKNAGKGLKLFRQTVSDITKDGMKLTRTFDRVDGKWSETSRKLVDYSKQIAKAKENAAKRAEANAKKLSQASARANAQQIREGTTRAKEITKGINLTNKFKKAQFSLKQTLPKEQYQQVMKTYKALGGTVGGKALSNLERINLANKKVSAGIRNAANAAKKGQRGFAGWAMSLMFFGMALKRVFDTVWKSSTKTFGEVMHSVEGTVTQFDLMDGSLKELQFMAGAALEPVVGFLIPIIDAVSDWISNNEGLFRSLVIATGVLGTIFAVGGSGYLALEGFRELKRILTLNFTSSWITKLSTFMITPVGAGITAAVLALAALGAVSWEAFKETPDAWEKINTNISEMDLTPLTSSLEHLSNTLLPSFTAKWSTLAWNFTWGAEVGAKAFDLIINKFALIVDSISASINAMKAFARAKDYLTDGLTKENYKAMTEAWDTAKNSIKRVKDDLFNRGGGLKEIFDLVKGGPDALRRKNGGSAIFNDSEITKLWENNMLDGQAIGALLNADARKETTLSDESEALLRNLLSQLIERSPTTINFTVGTNDEVISILDGLKNNIIGNY